MPRPEEVKLRQDQVEITVTPQQSLIDEKIDISVKGLLPGQPVTIKASLIGDSNEQFESFGQFTADEAGKVCLAKDHCHAGTYTGVDVMGLLWSMQLAPGQRKGQRLTKKEPTKPYYIHLQVFDGHIEDFRDPTIQPITSATFEKLYMASGVRRIPVREGRVRGTLFVPSGKGPFPGE